MGASFAFLGRIPFHGRWSARHHIAARISESHPVAFLEDPVRFPGGLLRERRPAAGGKVASVRPLDFPLQRVAFVRRQGARAAARALRDALPVESGPLVAVVYPRAPLDVLRELHAQRVVYHALDDYAERYDGQPDRDYLAWEAQVVDAADLVVAITTPLAERLRAAGAERVEVLPLGYDERLFQPGERPAARCYRATRKRGGARRQSPFARPSSVPALRRAHLASDRRSPRGSAHPERVCSR